MMVAIGIASQQAPAVAALATPVIVNEAPLSVGVGIGVRDAATLYYASQPTGQITFTLFQPGDTTCIGAAAFVSSVAVTANGRYVSPTTFYPTMAGTYRWKASYGGDARNRSATTSCSDLGALFVVAKRSPTIRTTATLSGDLTTTTAATALTGVGPTGPTGTMTFKLYGPNNIICLPPAAFTSTVAVAGNGTYTSPPVTPTLSGTYRWVASYGGDSNNYGGGNLCNDSANTVTIKAKAPAA